VNPQQQFLNPAADELVYQLQDEMREARAESQEKWRTFETERDKAAKSNSRQDDAVATRSRSSGCCTRVGRTEC